MPIVPDESRTFGMEGLFRQIGIWNQQGQNYVPEDHDQLMFYKESKHGQILQEGINEAGAMSDWIAAATSYSVHGEQMIPFYICYSMFGLQRMGPLLGGGRPARARLPDRRHGRPHDAERRGPAARGRPFAHALGTLPNCVCYDPTFAFEIAVIMQDGLRRMFAEQEDVYYYMTVMNENYEHPAMPEGAEADIIKGMYLLRGRCRRQVQGRRRACSCWARGDFPRGHRRRRTAQERLGRRRRPLGLPELQRTGARRQRRHAPELAASRREAEGSHVENCLNDTRDR